MSNYIENQTGGLFIFKKLYSLSKHGIRSWQIKVATIEKNSDLKGHSTKNYKLVNNEHCIVWTEYKYEKPGAKLTISAPTIIKSGKNIGKKNETTVVEQALKNATSKYEKKIKDGSVDNIDLIKSIDVNESDKLNYFKKYKLMAAKNYNTGKNSEKIKYPAIAQIKYDGARMCCKLANSTLDLLKDKKLNNDDLEFNKIKEINTDKLEIDTYSRALTEFPAKQNLNSELQILFKKFPDYYFDGEYYVHGCSLQHILSLVKNPLKGDNLQYFIFDCFNNLTDPASIRILKKLEIVRKFTIDNKFKYVKVVPVWTIPNKEDLIKLYEKKVNEGYEGLMVKNLDGIYELSLSREKRSFNMQKLKPHFDSEYPVIGFKEGVGKNKGMIIFILKAKSKEFSAIPKTTDEIKKKLFMQAKKYPDLFIGKQGTVLYDALSDDNVPQRVRFKNYRGYGWDYFLNYKK